MPSYLEVHCGCWKFNAIDSNFFSNRRSKESNDQTLGPEAIGNH